MQKRSIFVGAALLSVSVLVAGCATFNAPSSSLSPICEALIGPIKYNSTAKGSPRYAAPSLSPDLKQRNQVGRNLGCPQYANGG